MSINYDFAVDFYNRLLPLGSIIGEFDRIEQDMTGKEYITGKQIRDWLIKHFKSENNFFFDSDNQNGYDLLAKTPDGTRNYDEKYEYISNLLLKSILCHDIPFTFSFINRLCEPACDKAGASKYDINEYIRNKGQYGLLAIDNKKSDYHLFIKAFNRFWDNKRNLFMDYLNKKLFNREDMKQINDGLFHELLTSQEFAGIIRESYDMDRYCEWESIISYNYQLSTLQNSIIRKKQDKDNGYSASLQCFANYLLMSIL